MDAAVPLSSEEAERFDLRVAVVAVPSGLALLLEHPAPKFDAWY